LANKERVFIRPDDLRRGTPRPVRSEVTRTALLHAAARVVGELGYAEASVARITKVAGVAQGTFYNYFQSRQEILDQILPSLSDEMLEYIRVRVSGMRDAVEREEKQFRAFFEFLAERPEFFRVLHEAEQFTPDAFRTHHSKVETGYTRWLARVAATGALKSFSAEELMVVARILMAARDYISSLYSLSDGKTAHPLPGVVVTAYMKLLEGGLFAPPARELRPQRQPRRSNGKSTKSRPPRSIDTP
jgi:AcrR family transcriptional regulator